MIRLTSHFNLETKFFGRTQALNLLKKRLTDLKAGCRQNVALLGNRYLGKTTILQNFLADLDDNDVIPIYLDLDHKDFPYFFRKLAGSLLYEYAKSCQLPLHEDLNLLCATANDRIPQTVQVIEKIQKDFGQGKYSASYMGLLLLPEIFTKETGKFCILVFDEFQNLERFGLPHVFQSLGKKIMTQKRCFYVMSSSYKAAAQKILSEKLSLLFGNFETIDVDAFDVHTSGEFIRLNLFGSRIGDPLCNFLTDFTGGHPLYLDLICRELRNLIAVHRQSEIFEPILTQAVENTLFDQWGVISRHFELIINDLCAGKGNDIIAPVMIAMANGRFKIDDMAAESGIKKHQIAHKMNRLIDLGLVVKNGHLHYYKDKLFKYWMKFVYQRRLCGVELALDRQRIKFREDFRAGLEDFYVTLRQDFSARIIDLFYCFDNELLNLNGRRYKLPVFKSIAPCQFRCDDGQFIDVIKASTEDSVWYIVSKSGLVAESDVNAILRETKKMAPKTGRCLIVSLSDVDEHTRLKALQEKFWIWNEQELNTLLTLFNKPTIVQ